MQGSNPLVGAWKLVSWELMQPDGTVQHLYGRNVVGYLLYTADGYMSAEIMHPDRQQSNPRVGMEPPMAQTLSDRDRVGAYNTYLSYCGPYTVKGGTVIHHVKAGLIPGWVGTDQVRPFSIEGGRLVIAPGGHKLTWERVDRHG